MGYDGDKKRAYQLAWIQRRRNAWIQANGPCVDCGSWEDPEVDHDDPTQKGMEVASIWSRRLEVREQELSKCVVRCTACHLEKSNKERASRGRPCPSTTAYMRGCRCIGCKAVQRERVRQWRASRQ